MVGELPRSHSGTSDEFARPVTLETGQLIDDPQAEVMLGADIIDYYAENAGALPRTTTLTPSSGEAEVGSSQLGGRALIFYGACFATLRQPIPPINLGDDFDDKG